jgi:hypothetical protein
MLGSSLAYCNSLQSSGSKFGKQNTNQNCAQFRTNTLLVHHHHGRINDRFNGKNGPLACKRKSCCMEELEQLDSLQSLGSATLGARNTNQSFERTNTLLVHHHHGRIIDRFTENKGPLACRRKSCCFEVVEQVKTRCTHLAASLESSHESILSSISNQRQENHEDARITRSFR